MARKYVEIPEAEFTVKDLTDAYPSVSGVLLYSRIREWIKEGKIEKLGRVAHRKGSGLMHYRPIESDKGHN